MVSRRGAKHSSSYRAHNARARRTSAVNVYNPPRGGFRM